MKDFIQLNEQIENVFKDYLLNLLRLNGQRLKYYYWSLDFFENVGGLSFKYFDLSQDEKNLISSIGDFYFDDSDVYFEVNKNSHRHDLTVRNFNKIFTSFSSKISQTNRYEYIKEFILWDILNKLHFSSKIEKYKVDIQKKNFLYTYLKFFIDNNERPIYRELSDYTSFKLTFQGQDVKKKIREIEAKGVSNEILENRINQLYVHKDDVQKLHFVFSYKGGEEKEELRELLDVMGRKETGKLYRGQADSSWELNASLTRQPKYREHESEMYYEILSLKPDSFVHDNTVYERLITMQHFGMPTRLMDVTRNPLVSIFFACNNLQRANVDGLVYTFSQDSKKILNFEDKKLESLKLLFDKSSDKPEDLKKDKLLSDIWFIKGVAKNQRIHNQSGDFIFVGLGDDIEEKLKSLPTMCIIIDSKTKKILLEQLESLNIHGGAVYPDLTHMSSYISNKYLYQNFGDSQKELLIFKNITGKRTTKRTNKEIENVIHPPKKEVEIKKLVNDFDEKTFWSKKRLNKLNQYATTQKFNDAKLKEILENFYFKDRIEHDAIRKALSYQVPLKERVSKLEELSDEIKAFAEELKK